VNDARQVEVLDAAEHLVEEVGHALVVQVHVDHLAQVRVHQLHHDVQVQELLERLLRRERVQKADYLKYIIKYLIASVIPDLPSNSTIF
jgi:hypothetical protein